MMTLEDLDLKLKQAGVLPEQYYLNGIFGSTNDHDKPSLVIKRIGSVTTYETYYKEKGEKHSVKVFDTEDEACDYLLQALTFSKDVQDKYLREKMNSAKRKGTSEDHDQKSN
jgi:hypothetical protein